MNSDSFAPQASPAWTIPRVVWYSILVVCTYVAVQLIVAFVLRVALFLAKPDLYISARVAQPGDDGLYFSLATIGTAVVCVPLIRKLVARREKSPWEFLCVRSVDLRTTILWCLGVLAFIAGSDLVSISLGRPIVPEFMRTVYESTSPILLLLILVLAAPPIEELFFRGFVIGGLESSGVSPMAAALVSSLAWAAIHLQYDFYGMQTIFVSGLLLAWARCKTGSIIPCVVMHGLANAVSFAETAILSRQAIV